MVPPRQDDLVVELSEVVKRLSGKVVLDAVSFSVRRGTVHGLLGPNGSGKTTSLRLIVGLLRPDSGTVRVLGSLPSRGISDRIGYLPEERGLYRKMTVRNVLDYYGRLKCGQLDAADVDRWLTRLGIAEYAGHRVEALSKGTAQKAQFAACVLSRPELLILDEPFSGLDPLSASLLRSVILELRREGVTVILSTHDMDTAEKMCDAVSLLHGGRFVLDGTRAQIEQAYGERTIKVALHGNLPDLPEVERTIDFGAYQELVLKPGADPQSVLRRLSDAGSVQQFVVSKPSLHDLFLRLAHE